MSETKISFFWQKAYRRGFVILILLGMLYTFFSSISGGYKDFQSQFFQKSYLIGTFNRIKIKLGDRVFPGVLIGKDGWLEYLGEGNIDDFQHANLFSNEDLHNTAHVLKACDNYLRQQGVEFLIVVAPNKASVYPEKVPEEIKLIAPISRLEQLNQYLRGQNIPELLDLRLALIQGREENDMYYRTDTHWNGYGAYIAYSEILSKLSNAYPVLVPYSEKFFRIRRYSYPSDNFDLTRILNLNNTFNDRIMSKRDTNDFVYRFRFPDTFGLNSISTIPNSNLPTLMMFHDSFGYTQLNFFLSMNFGQMYHIHQDATLNFLNPNTLNQLSPDIVIYETIERNLWKLPYNLSGCTNRVTSSP